MGTFSIEDNADEVLDYTWRAAKLWSEVVMGRKKDGFVEWWNVKEVQDAVKVLEREMEEEEEELGPKKEVKKEEK